MTAGVRYIVDDMDKAVEFYTGNLDFTVTMRPSPSFAMLDRGDLRLLLSLPNMEGGGGHPMPDGTPQKPGGWNRISLVVPDLESMVSALEARGARFRNEIVHGVGGNQILLEDPSGNLVELFEPRQQSL